MVGVEYTGTGFCVGDNVSFTCNIPSNFISGVLMDLDLE